MKAKSVVPFLWFESGAAEAADFYVSVFEDSEILGRINGPGAEPIGVTLRILEQELTLFNGGSYHKLDEAFSLFITVETQEEVDYFWNTLIADGGEPSQCGWLKDKFGVSWQVCPEVLINAISGDDAEASARASEAMLQMTKFDVAKLQAAVDGTS